MFHNFSILSGLLLHLMPSKNLWAVHWFAKLNKGFMHFDLPLDISFTFDNVLMYLKGVYTVYLTWLVFYYIVIFHIKGKDKVTTFEHVMQHSKTIKKFCF